MPAHFQGIQTLSLSCLPIPLSLQDRQVATLAVLCPICRDFYRVSPVGLKLRGGVNEAQHAILRSSLESFGLFARWDAVQLSR